jgi:drug/metabolite transporter (DMT)-like permease
VGEIDIVSFSIGQCITCTLLNLILGFTLEWHTIPAISTSWGTIIYTGIFSVGLAYTLQAFGQKHSPPADCAIILGTESIFAAVCGYLILGEILTTRQIIGCGLILLAALLAQLWSINSQYRNNSSTEKQSPTTEIEKKIEREKA